MNLTAFQKIENKKLVQNLKSRVIQNFFNIHKVQKIENNTHCQNYEFDHISKNENKKLVQNLKSRVIQNFSIFTK